MSGVGCSSSLDSWYIAVEFVSILLPKLHFRAVWCCSIADYPTGSAVDIVVSVDTADVVVVGRHSIHPIPTFVDSTHGHSPQQYCTERNCIAVKEYYCTDLSYTAVAAGAVFVVPAANLSRSSLMRGLSNKLLR